MPEGPGFPIPEGMLEKVSYDQGHPFLFVSACRDIDPMSIECMFYSLSLFLHGLTVLDVIVSTWVSGFDVLISKVQKLQLFFVFCLCCSLVFLWFLWS